MLTTILNEEAAKVASASPNLSVEHIDIAKKYMIKEIGAKVPSDFLTT